MDAKQYFKSHPDRQQVFQTADGFLFPMEPDAKNHAKTLNDKGVKKLTNSIKVTTDSVEDVQEAIVGEGETSQTEQAKPAAKKTAATKKAEAKPEALESKESLETQA